MSRHWVIFFFFLSKPTFTFKYNFFVQLWSITVHFRDKRPDTVGGAWLVLSVCLFAWESATQKVPHIIWKSANKSAHSLFIHILTLGFFNATQTLVDNVRFLYPHVYSRPKSLGQTFTSRWKLYICEFGHNLTSEASRKQVCLPGENKTSGSRFYTFGKGKCKLTEIS